MKILLLQPPSPPGMNVKRDYAGGMGVADLSARGQYGHDPDYITLPYMSLLYSAAILEKHGHKAVFIDAQADNLGLAGVMDLVIDEDPELLVSVLNLPSIYGDLKFLKGIKERHPSLHVAAVGAVTVPLFDLISGSGAVDVIIRGDPEIVLPDLAEAFVMGGRDLLDAAGAGIDKFELKGKVLTNRVMARITDLNRLPRLPYHLVPLDKYRYHGFEKGVRYAALFASRGCCFGCYYCPYPVGFGSNIIYRNIIDIVDEIEDLKKRYGVEGILFRDQVFTMDPERVHQLCDEIIRRHLKIAWVVETRLDRVDEALLRKMKEAGCVRIHYGLESGDPEMFARVAKGGVQEKMEDLICNFKLTEKTGIHPHMFLLIGLLGETKDSIRRTMRTIREIKPLTLQVSIVTPYPGTPLFEEADRKGLIVTKDWSQYTGFNAVMRTETLSVEDLIKAKKVITRYHRRVVRWKRLAYLARLALKYAGDGSLWKRVCRRLAFME